MKNLKAGNIYKDVLFKRNDHLSYEINKVLEKAYIDGDKLTFNNYQSKLQAFKDGIFMLKIPEDLDLQYCDLFAQNFYKKNSSDEKDYSIFRNYTSDNFDDNLLGFHERVDQIEQFLLERRFWEKWYPKEIYTVGERLCEISKMIITNILSETGMHTDGYSKATGGCTNKEGSYHLTFNHYRKIKKAIGLSSHKDDGFITILRSIFPGLEVNRESKWERIIPDKKYFIINFGLSMEILTKESEMPVSAIMHRVAKQQSERWSWGHFSSSNCVNDQGIYKYSKYKGLEYLCNSRDLINNNDYEIYNGTKTEDSDETSN